MTLLLFAPGVGAQGGRKERPELDPYTKGEAEALRTAGYSSLGPFVVGEGHTSETVLTYLGNPPILWIETEHFRLGCSLDEYKVVETEERRKIRKELARLKLKLPRVKSKAKTLDPWLRAHLFAQRLEELHSEFCETLGVLPSGTEPPGASRARARVGTKGPLSVLVLQLESSLSRYTQEFCTSSRADTHTEFFQGTGTFLYGIADGSVESTDTALHYAVAYGVAQALGFSIDGFPNTPPRWWTVGLGRYFARRVDSKIQLYMSAGGDALPSDKLADWETLVLGRVNADYYPDWESTLAWSDAGEMKFADHMLLWSRMDYLLDQDAEIRAKLVEAFHGPVEATEDWRAVLSARHANGLTAATGMGMDELDAAWCLWVRENYTKKGRRRRGR